MSRLFPTVAFVLAGFASAIPAHADHAPTFVVPGRADVPTVINGWNANWAVVEGDWGLHRPGHMPQTVIGGVPLKPAWGRRSYSPAYYPAYGIRPGRGRNEIEPSRNRALPEPAESFSRSWSTSSKPSRANPARFRPRGFDEPEDVPATIPDPNAYNGPVMVVPGAKP
jgi:hypothetical protein